MTLLLAVRCATAEAADEPSGGKTSAVKTVPVAEIEKPAESETKPPAAEAEEPPPKPEQVSYEYVLGVLRALTEGSERRYSAMEDQIARLKAQIDALNRAAETPLAKDNVKVPPSKSDGKNAVVAPLAATRAPAAKPPAWVGIGLQQVGKEYRVSAQIGPYSRPTELEAEWPVAMQGAVDCYARRQFGPRAVGQVHLSEAELRSLVREEWTTTEDYAAGPMKTHHVLVVFDPAMQTRIRTLWEGGVIARRLEYAGTALTGGLLLLGILFACLKLDHSTAGAYRVRLVLAGALLAGALTAGTIAAVQIVGAPAETPAAEGDAATRTVSVSLSDDGSDAASGRQATATAGATSLLVWLGAVVGLLGVLLLFSVGKKPAAPDALKETAVHETALPYEPLRHGSGALAAWIGLSLVILVLLLASAFLFIGSAVRVPGEPSPTPATSHPAPDATPPPAQPAPKAQKGDVTHF